MTSVVDMNPYIRLFLYDFIVLLTTAFVGKAFRLLSPEEHRLRRRRLPVSWWSALSRVDSYFDQDSKPLIFSDTFIISSLRSLF